MHAAELTSPALHARRHLAPQQGLSVVELMVGVTIGLFILAGASMVVSGQLSDNRRLMLETQVQQDLRAAADLIVRDLRRAGYHGNAATLSVWPQDATQSVAANNVYAAITPASAPTGSSSINYSYSRDYLEGRVSAGSNDNNTIDSSEQFGFRLDPTGAGTIQMQVGGGGWQALTDAGVLEVTAFTVTINSHDLPIPCALACAPGAANCPPVQTVRDVLVQITGRARHDPQVQRSITGDVRLRNDLVSGACPTS